jgi:hypothetical protein
MTTKTHKASGWTRTALGYGNWTIAPTDDSGIREVAFMSRHSWANYPNDNRANIDKDRVILLTGEPLPAWAMEWLEKANARSCERGRAALQSALDDADWNEARRDADSY